MNELPKSKQVLMRVSALNNGYDLRVQVDSIAKQAFWFEALEDHLRDVIIKVDL